MKSWMKEIFKIGIAQLIIVACTSISFSQDAMYDTTWTRYNLEDLALFADVSNRLEPFCGGSSCSFDAKNEMEFESISINRFYKDYEHDFHYFVDSSSNAVYQELLVNGTVIYLAHQITTEKEGRFRSSAFFSTDNYEYELAYVGPDSILFVRFLESIEINHKKLSEQFELNKQEPDYSKLDLKFEIDLGDKDYVVNGTKNHCKIRMPESDTIRLYPSCSGCMLRHVKDDEWVIIPSPKGDEIKISLQTNLPENRTYTFYEKTITVKREE